MPKAVRSFDDVYEREFRGRRGNNKTQPNVLIDVLVLHQTEDVVTFMKKRPLELVDPCLVSTVRLNSDTKALLSSIGCEDVCNTPSRSDRQSGQIEFANLESHREYPAGDRKARSSHFQRNPIRDTSFGVHHIGLVEEQCEYPVK